MRRAVALAAALLALSAAQAAPVVSLPADEAGHPEARTEWIYLCGHLGEGGAPRYGFMGAFFIIRPAKTSTAAPSAFAIIALTDEAGRAHHQTVITMAGSPAWNAERLALRYPHNRIERVGDAPPRFEAHLTIPGPLAAREESEMALDLALTSRSPALLINDGIIRFPSGRLTYYYSWPRLEASGTLRLRGRGEVAVTGTAWLEHQWGDFDAFEDFGRYDYFAVQLEDGTSLILLDLASPEGRRRLGRVMRPDGRQEAVTFESEALGRWTSPLSGATYPMGWTIRIEKPKMTLRLTPTLVEQEVSKFAPRRFWEGTCAVTGTVEGVAVTGRAFAELVGYDRGG